MKNRQIAEREEAQKEGPKEKMSWAQERGGVRGGRRWVEGGGAEMGPRDGADGLKKNT